MSIKKSAENTVRVAVQIGVVPQSGDEPRCQCISVYPDAERNWHATDFVYVPALAIQESTFYGPDDMFGLGPDASIVVAYSEESAFLAGDWTEWEYITPEAAILFGRFSERPAG